MTKAGVLSAIGAVGGWIATALGGMDYGLQALIIFMMLDYITGWAVAGVFHRSPKTETGALSSNVGLKGLCKKIAMLALVWVAVQLDLMIGSDYLRDAVIIALVVNELVSLLENLGLMGVPIPEVLKRAIELLNKKKEGSPHE